MFVPAPYWSTKSDQQVRMPGHTVFRAGSIHFEQLVLHHSSPGRASAHAKTTIGRNSLGNSPICRWLCWTGWTCFDQWAFYISPTRRSEGRCWFSDIARLLEILSSVILVWFSWPSQNWFHARRHTSCPEKWPDGWWLGEVFTPWTHQVKFVLLFQTVIAKDEIHQVATFAPHVISTTPIH